MTTVEALVSSLDGTVVLRDAGDSAVADIRRAAEAARRGGSQRGGGQIVGVAGGALMIRCADQYSTPTLRITVYDHPPAEPSDAGWTWLAPSSLVLGSGHLVLDSGGNGHTGWDGNVPVGTPGPYGVRVGYRGRAEFQDAATQVRVRTLNASDEDRTEAWQSLRGIEAYAIELWPELAA